MKNLKQLGVTQINTTAQIEIDGGVAPDENGKGCTEQGLPSIMDILKKGIAGPYNPGSDNL